MARSARKSSLPSVVLWHAAAVCCTTLAAASSAAADQRGSGTSGGKSCAAAYHARLAALAPTLSDQITSALSRARTPEKNWPGKWWFWDPHRDAIRRKLARAGYNARVIVIENQMCTNAVVGQGGRIRCLKWVPKPKNYVPPLLPAASEPGEPPPPERDERALLQALAPFVRARGAISSLRRPEVLYHLTQRLSNELRGYLGQPPSPSLCTGVPEMLAFYAEKLQPVMRVSTQAETQWITAGDAARKVSRAVAPTPPTVEQQQAVIWLRGAITRQAERFATRSRAAEIRGSSDLATTLSLAHDALAAPAAREAAPAEIANARLALRHIETAFYAKERASRLSAVARSLSGAIDAVRAAHAEACTCPN